MMISSVLMVFLTIHTANSYILLTANLEDVQAIAKQLATSPVADQLNRIWRRAASVFTQQISKNGPLQGRYQKRAQDEEEAQPNERGPGDQAAAEADPDLVQTNQVRRRSQEDEDLLSLGKNASLYLKSIRKIFEHVK